jgi:SPOR domain
MKCKLRIINVLCAFLLCFGMLEAQTIELNETIAIKDMMSKWAANNRTTTVVEGWRIQVASSTDRFEVQEAKERFLAAYPQFACDWYHEKPYYKLKAGAFKHSWEARKALNQMRSTFAVAYPVFDKKIKPADFMPIASQ